MWKEAIVASLNVLLRHLRGGIIKLSVVFPSNYTINTFCGSVFIGYNPRAATTSSVQLNGFVKSH
jgi:hypothetical protein